MKHLSKQTESKDINVNMKIKKLDKNRSDIANKQIIQNMNNMIKPN